MAVENPDFHEEGTQPGLAAGWAFETRVQRERVAAFGASSPQGVEDFERWWGLSRRFDAGDLTLSLFDPQAEGLEDFEEGWFDDVFLRALSGGVLSTASFDGGVVGRWEVSGYARMWSTVPQDALPVETFEGGPVWRRLDDTPATRATFGAVSQAREEFELALWPSTSTI